MQENEITGFFQKKMHIVLLAIVCTLLWGCAYPAVKTGYSAFQVAADAPAALMVFAGIRFFLAGIAVLLFSWVFTKRFPMPQKADVPGILSLGLVQTVGQYVFYYIGLAHTSGVRASILNAASTFITVLLSGLFWHQRDRLTGRKLIGCAVGLAGVILVNLGGSIGTAPFSLIGEGFILICALMSAIGAILSKVTTQGLDPILITGWQLSLGGGLMLLGGLCSGGRLGAVTVGGCALMALMVFISAASFTLWTFLLKYNPVSQVVIFAFLIPVFGAILSSLVLSEPLFSPVTLLSLVLVSTGILLVNRES